MQVIQPSALIMLIVGIVLLFGGLVFCLGVAFSKRKSGKAKKEKKEKGS
jgi:flagellar basal body-associated protein FliL